MPERAKIFAECGKVVTKAAALSSEQVKEFPDVKEFVDAVAQARLCTLEIVYEIVDARLAGEECSLAQHMKNVLADIHQGVRYTFDDELIVEKIVRDLCELCATLRSIELGVERSSRGWLTEAGLFCAHMQDELKQIEE